MQQILIARIHTLAETFPLVVVNCMKLISPRYDVFDYPNIPQKTIGVNLIALAIQTNNFPLGFHHL